jgi:hypothetical protein
MRLVYTLPHRGHALATRTDVRTLRSGEIGEHGNVAMRAKEQRRCEGLLRVRCVRSEERSSARHDFYCREGNQTRSGENLWPRPSWLAPIARRDDVDGVMNPTVETRHDGLRTVRDNPRSPPSIWSRAIWRSRSTLPSMPSPAPRCDALRPWPRRDPRRPQPQGGWICALEDISDKGARSAPWNDRFRANWEAATTVCLWPESRHTA